MIRNEYPRPQFKREDWTCLNGTWEFAFDDNQSGVKKEWFKPNINLPKTITVPFVYQTELSGINTQEVHDCVWYKKKLMIDPVNENECIVLHFGAVDYETYLYVNGQYVGKHIGGHSSFSFDISDFLVNEEEQDITLQVFDYSKDETIPRGKQYWQNNPESIWYTNTTGIWQTVWLEKISKLHIKNVKMTPNVDDGELEIVAFFSQLPSNHSLKIMIHYDETLIYDSTMNLFEKEKKETIDIYQNKIFNTPFHHSGINWTPETANLFDITFTLFNERQEIVDHVKSYFGMRKIHTENGMVYLNNKPYYQKLVLDQGYWPTSLMTAPTDEDFKQDILLAKEMGFNGCRKHQKFEDPRFLYWADQLGFLVWGECPSTISYDNQAVERLTKEWLEIIERDYNHPSIVTWVPLNESWGTPNISKNKVQQHFSQMLYHLIHSLDKTRLVISNDGWEATKTDICAVHNYIHGEQGNEQQYQDFQEMLKTKEAILNSYPAQRPIYAEGFEHKGEPIMLTEFGGIGFQVAAQEGWGYSSVKNEADFVSEYSRVMKAIYESDIIHGYCYTQLTDVEQEINGLLTYDRKPKCSLAEIKKINDQYHLPFVKGWKQ